MSDGATRIVIELAARLGPGRCLRCGTNVDVRLYGVAVDGKPLRLQVPLCPDHGDAYLIRAGELLGELLRGSV